VFFSDPDPRRPNVCVMKFETFNTARTQFGTDEDLIFIANAE